MPIHDPCLRYPSVPAVVSRSTEEEWVWYATELNGHPAGGLVAANGPSVAYSILDAPVAPWTDAVLTNQNAWTSALDFVITNACEGATTETNALAELTQFLFSGHGLVYDIKGGWPNYCTSSHGGIFRLSKYIAKTGTGSPSHPMSGNEVDCYDQASAITALGRLIGVNVLYRHMPSFGYVNETDLIGIGRCNNPFYPLSSSLLPIAGSDDVYPARLPFGNHSFAEYNALIFDACAGPACGTSPIVDYLNTAIDSSTFPEQSIAGNAGLLETGNVTALE